MKTLTLEQVQRAGRFAFWMRKDGSAVVVWCPRAQFRPWAALRIGDYAVAEKHRGNLQREGWQHLPGCDCEFCSEHPPA